MIETKTYKERPELSNLFSAIDGIEGPTHERGGAQKPIRSDIEEVLSMSEPNFNDWHKKRKEATKKLLSNYELFVSIPHLYYSHETQRENMTAITHVRDHLDYLKRGLKFLEIIRERYYEKTA